MTKIIGIAGRKGHGKDTAAQALLDEGYVNVKFAGALKVMVRAFLAYVGVSPDTIERMIEGDLKEVPNEHFGGRTTRYVLQTLGTEWGREMVFDRIWVNAFSSRAKRFDKVACTDMRFPNEVDEVKAQGGTTVRVVRPNAPRTAGSDHPSEALIDTLHVDHVIANDEGIEELHRRIAAIAYWRDHA
jgi:hypothetical protein